jgi:hypothetical protein
VIDRVVRWLVLVIAGGRASSVIGSPVILPTGCHDEQSSPRSPPSFVTGNGEPHRETVFHAVGDGSGHVRVSDERRPYEQVTYGNR